MQAKAARDEVRLSVITDYLQVLYNKELLEVSREQLRLSQCSSNAESVARRRQSA